MKTILGIDTGTNSLGWAIVEKEGALFRLLDKGVNIFQEGVNKEKDIEKSKAAERTAHRAVRIGYYRTKLRKIKLLRILIAHHLCPPLSSNALREWRSGKHYPTDELFMQWQRTDECCGQNPYAFRHQCLHEKLDLDKLSDRYILGRAFYHINQRRGFLSNRKEQDKGETGIVKDSINTLTHEMEEAGYQYLGDYFYHLYQKGEKIRKHYTARNAHYLKEFYAICEKQGLDSTLAKELEHAIFYQRPLKSQRGIVGKCKFEKNKSKCPSSHPLYEEFRMLSFINNIQIQTPQDDTLRPLNDVEREKILPLFYRKSKNNFDFEDIAKKLAPKKLYGFYKRAADVGMPFLFNFPMDQSVSGCPVTTALRGIFGDNWFDSICEKYTLADGKSRIDILNDIWHVLFFYEDSTKLAEFAQKRLQLTEGEAIAFSKISLPSDYASLSLKAIRKILPYLRRGIIYSHAVFLGNLCEVMPAYEWGVDEMREAAIDGLISEMQRYDGSKDPTTFEACIKDYLQEKYHISAQNLKKLYHPSMIDIYPRVRANEEGIYQLGSPRTDSIRNPMAMRSLFRLRKLVNRLLADGKIDQETEIHIEFSRELNDANMRSALKRYGRDNQRIHDGYREQLKVDYKKETGKAIDPTDTDILKYSLWEEQNHLCLYTGKNIAISDFIGPNPKYDIEHTVPRSRGGDSTKENLTLCDSRFNREIKGVKLPTELANYDDILLRIAYCKAKFESLEQQIRKQKRASKVATTKDQKDKAISYRHFLELKRNYWKGKYARFTMETVPEGFSRRQGVDIGVISKYAYHYLRSVFRRVYTVKGIATSDFRKIWGVQDIYSKKERVNHVHHCIDAIVIACIGLDEYNKLGAYYHDEEHQRWYGASKASFSKPWPSFVEDVKRVQDELLVYHYTPDNMPKQGRRRIKLKGKKLLAKGDAARSSLHNDTYYGAIEREGDVKYVKRIALSILKDSDIKNIVDDTVRNIIQKAVAQLGFKEAMASTIWMNEEKQIPIKKVRCYTPSVTRPLHIRVQRDLSTKVYKREFHVDNDKNYMMAIYIGHDAKGKEKRDFELLNNLQAACFYKTSNDHGTTGNPIVPIKSQRDFPLAYVLKKGTLVFLYESSPSEVYEAIQQELSRRLYKITELSTQKIKQSDKSYYYGAIVMRHHEEARQSTEIKKQIKPDGAYKQDEPLRPMIKMSHKQLRALVQGVHFEINELGKITWLVRND